MIFGQITTEYHSFPSFESSTIECTQLIHERSRTRERKQSTVVALVKTRNPSSRPLRHAQISRQTATRTQPVAPNHLLLLISARYYDAKRLSRFISKDPLGYPDGMNPFASYFVPNGLDPTGLDWQSWVENSEGIWIHTYSDPRWNSSPELISSEFIPWDKIPGTTKGEKREALNNTNWRQFVIKEYVQGIANQIDTNIRVAGVVILMVSPADEGLLVALAAKRGLQLVRVGRGWKVFRKGKELGEKSAEKVLNALSKHADTPRPRRITNPKHHPKSSSPEPPNVGELFENSVCAENDTRWAIDENGNLHRFCAKQRRSSLEWVNFGDTANPIK